MKMSLIHYLIFTKIFIESCNCIMINEYDFIEIAPNKEDWELIENTYDTTIYKTRQWFEYINKQKCKPFIVRIEKKGRGELIGFFVGEKIKRGITLIASPFEGIGTGHQGLSMLEKITSEERLRIYYCLSRWIFKKGLSWFIQIEDWQLTMDDINENDIFYYEPHRVKYVDLSPSEDQLFENLHKDCKYSLRKARDNGIIVRDANDIDAFINTFFSQLEDVFGKQYMHPTRDKENVRKMVESTWPNETMLLEAVTPEGDVAATAIIPIHSEYSATWQTASFRKYQKLRPNEILRWEAMLRCKRRGATMINFCGTQAYKDKFGAILTHTPRLYYCKYPFLIRFKMFAKFLYYSTRRIFSSIKESYMSCSLLKQ